MEVNLEDHLPTFKADGHREGDRSFLLADWSRTPESEFLSGEAGEILEEALQLLPEHYRAILVLRDVEELPNEEVAEVLGESVSTVKSRLRNAAWLPPDTRAAPGREVVSCARREVVRS